MEKLNKAIEFASIKHANQKRKGTTIPYIVHPIEVMQILRENGASENAQIAGVLHDTIEDTATTYAEIKELFGADIANMVGMESEKKGIPYRERKYEHMKRLKDCGTREEKMVNCADKLSNLRSIYIDIKTNGDSTWQKFNAPKEDICWYYGLSIKCFEEIRDTKMYKELCLYFEKVFNQKVEQQTSASEIYYDTFYKEPIMDLSKFKNWLEILI